MMLVIFLFMLISASVKVVPEYQQAVLFRLGRLRGRKDPVCSHNPYCRQDHARGSAR